MQGEVYAPMPMVAETCGNTGVKPAAGDTGAAPVAHASAAVSVARTPEALCAALPEGCLDRIVESVTQAAPVEQLFVFGSWARGEQSGQSDIDLFAVMPDGACTDENHIKMIASVDWVGPWNGEGLPLGCDVLCCDRSTFDGRKGICGRVYRDVAREGVSVYG